jgi:diguanylate cyclase (GGDEF)-like protein
LGSLLDPAIIQQKLVSAAAQLFPGQPVAISYGQTPDPVDAYVVQRRQPVLVPSDTMKGVPTLAAPVCAQQSVVGVLRVGGVASPQVYSRDDLRLLEILANLASLAMDNCVLFNNVQQSALRDNLTGLLTHRAFDDQLEQAVLEASRYNQPLSLILADIDHFKSVNDTYGHQAGDAVLQGFAHVMDRNTRPVDVIARYGGEEFVVLLLQTTHAEAVQLAEKIRRDMSEQVFEAGGRPLAITGSFGVATFPEDATSQQQLFRQADQRMYKAKAGGRNQVKSRLA